MKKQIIIIILLILNALIVFAPIDIVKGAWWNGDWDYFRTITVESDYIDDNLDNFPLLVVLDNSTGDYAFHNSGADIRFLSTDNFTKFNYEIEKFNNSGNTSCWVNISETLEAGTDYTFLVYYGNAGASDNQNPTGVWDSNFIAVYHMNSTTTTLPDSTEIRHGLKSGQANPLETEDGIIANAQDYDAIDDFIICDKVGAILDMTVECWYRPESTIGNVEMLVENTYYAAESRKGFTLNRHTDGTIYWAVQKTGGTIFTVISTETVNANNWYYFAGVLSDENYGRLFINGTQDGEDDSITGDMTNDADAELRIGIDQLLTTGAKRQYADGIIDEVRISKIARSNAWINTSFHTQNQTTGFMAFGSEQEPLPNNPPTITSWNADTEPGATSGWDWDNNDLQVDWNVADTDTDSLTLLWTFSRGGTPDDPTTGSYDGRKTGIGSGSYTMTDQDLDWTSGTWENYRGTVNFKFRLHDGTNYSTTIETDSLTGGIDGTDPSTTIMDQPDADDGPDSIWGTATDTTCYVASVDLYIKNTTDATWWTGSGWSTETWLSSSANDSFDSASENWNYDSSGVAWGSKNYEIGANTTDESGRDDGSPATDTFTITEPTWTILTFGGKATVTGLNPVISNEQPSNESANVNMYPMLNITVNDPRGYSFNVTWLTNASGPWTAFAYNSSCVNGTYRQRALWANSSYTTYWWQVKINNTLQNWTNATYWFQTATYTWGSWSDFWVFTFAEVGVAPIQSGEVPANSSTDISITPQLYVLCTDADDDNMNATWWSNSSGPWLQFASNSTATGFANNTNITQTNSNFSAYNATYWWSVNLTDGTDWTNETYHFTTVANNPPTQSGEVPANSSTDISLTPSLHVVCTDADSDTMTATWRSNSSSAWVDFATNTSISTGTNITQTNSNFSAYGTTYYWSVNLTDGTDWTNATYHFTTVANNPPAFSSEVPANESTNVTRTTAAINVTIEDPDGDTFNWTIETSPDVGSSSANDESNGNKSCGVSGLVYGTTYTWYVNCTDGTDWTREWFTFDTSANTPPNITCVYPVNNSIDLDRIPQCYVCVNDINLENLTVSFYYNNSDGTWIFDYNETNVPSNSTVYWNYTEADDFEILYQWKVIVNDSIDEVIEIFSFTTNRDTSEDTNYSRPPEDYDTDGDGLTDGQEEAFGSNPLLPDTDLDGHTDYEEYVDGTDPIDPLSYLGAGMGISIEILLLIVLCVMGFSILLIFVYKKERKR